MQQNRQRTIEMTVERYEEDDRGVAQARARKFEDWTAGISQNIQDMCLRALDQFHPLGLRTSAFSLKDTKSTSHPNKTHLKNFEHWRVIDDGRLGDEVVFRNDHLSYASYDPPRGYTAEEIMQFRGAKEVYESVEDIQAVMNERDKYSTLDHETPDPEVYRKHETAE
ncbi:hypothetical protein H0H92_007529 [Tricholoma furcatifolium]|nr:hypothetical protein H0H92_007529 [Tricholoma furcatifolium]